MSSRSKQGARIRWTIGILPLRASLAFSLSLIIASSLFVFTISLFLGIYRSGFLASDEHGDVLVISDKRALSPATGTIPIYVANLLTMIQGVKAISPEAISLCVLGDNPVTVRGVIPDRFYEFFDLELEGREIQLNDTYSVLIGYRLAKRLDISTGDRIFIFSSFRERFVEVKVVGMFRSGSSLDDEIIAPLLVGQWLRGISYGQVSLIRVKIDLSRISREKFEKTIFSKHIIELELRYSSNKSEIPRATLLLYDLSGNFILKENATNGRALLEVPIGSYRIYPCLGDLTADRPYEVNVTSDVKLVLYVPSNLSKRLEEISPRKGSSSKLRGYEHYFSVARTFLSSENLDVGVPKGEFSGLLERSFGITQETLWALSALIFLIAGLTISQASSILIKDMKMVLNILRTIGASEKYILGQLMLLIALISAICGLLGYLLGMALFLGLSSMDLLIVASHAVEPSFDLSIMLTSIILSASLGIEGTYKVLRETVKTCPLSPS